MSYEIKHIMSDPQYLTPSGESKSLVERLKSQGSALKIDKKEFSPDDAWFGGWFQNNHAKTINSFLSKNYALLSGLDGKAGLSKEEMDAAFQYVIKDSGAPPVSDQMARTMDDFSKDYNALTRVGDESAKTDMGPAEPWLLSENDLKTAAQNSDKGFWNWLGRSGYHGMLGNGQKNYDTEVAKGGNVASQMQTAQQFGAIVGEQIPVNAEAQQAAQTVEAILKQQGASQATIDAAKKAILDQSSAQAPAQAPASQAPATQASAAQPQIATVQPNADGTSTYTDKNGTTINAAKGSTIYVVNGTAYFYQNGQLVPADGSNPAAGTSANSQPQTQPAPAATPAATPAASAPSSAAQPAAPAASISQPAADPKVDPNNPEAKKAQVLEAAKEQQAKTEEINKNTQPAPAPVSTQPKAAPPAKPTPPPPVAVEPKPLSFGTDGPNVGIVEKRHQDELGATFKPTNNSDGGAKGGEAKFKTGDVVRAYRDITQRPGDGQGYISAVLWDPAAEKKATELKFYLAAVNEQAFKGKKVGDLIAAAEYRQALDKGYLSQIVAEKDTEFMAAYKKALGINA